MTKQQPTILLNGKRYDALSGKMLDAPIPVKRATKIAAMQTGKVLDGFIRKRRPATVSNAVHKKPEHSKTLMRKAVKKPDLTATTATQKQGASTPIKKTLANTTPFRELRAAHTPKSNFISRFGSEIARGTSVVTAVMPVKQPPEEGENHIVAAPTIASTVTAKVSAASAIIERGLQAAVSHEQPATKRETRRHKAADKLGISTRSFNLGAGAVSVLLLSGFIAYQNLPNLSMRVASAKSGVRASMPGYHPAGFALTGPIKYQAGTITLSYHSNNRDNRGYQITQRSSEWNSDTLLQNFVATNRRSYQSYQDNGKTIYIYEGDNATWVDGGIWYQVEGDAALNSDQLLHIAKSL